MYVCQKLWKLVDIIMSKLWGKTKRAVFVDLALPVLFAVDLVLSCTLEPVYRVGHRSHTSRYCYVDQRDTVRCRDMLVGRSQSSQTTDHRANKHLHRPWTRTRTSWPRPVLPVLELPVCLRRQRARAIMVWIIYYANNRNWVDSLRTLGSLPGARPERPSSRVGLPGYKWRPPYCQPQTNHPLLPIFLPARRYASAGLCDSDVSVCLSVCHTPVLCLAERKQDREMYTVW